MKKLVVMVCAILGAYLVLPLMFPSLKRVAFEVGHYSVTWALVVTAVVVFFGTGMSEAK